MILTMLSRFRSAGLLAVLVCLAGCGRSSYRHQVVDADSRETEEVMHAVARIRARGDAGVGASVADFGAPDLPKPRREALLALFTDIARADEVELLELDQFGDRIYRASFSLLFSRESKVIHVLLVKVGGQLYWAGLN